MTDIGIKLSIICKQAAENHTLLAKSMHEARRQSRCLLRAFKAANPNPTALTYYFVRPNIMHEVK